MKMARKKILDEREKTHGDFSETAEIAQELKYIIHLTNGVILSQAQMEALEMICTKIARILSGNPYEPDHWKDIAGYAELGAEACDFKP